VAKETSLINLPKFSKKAFLAPMAGVSDPALRLLCKEMGAGLVVTELTSIHAIIAKKKQLALEQKKINNFLEFSEQERPISIQLFGSDLNALKEAAQIVEPFFDIIDYNMGCPAPHITQQMAGGALLQTPQLTRKIFRTLVNSVERPITLKLRSGANLENQHMFKEIAIIAQEEGIQMITLHPRTVKQGYSGTANWNLIKELKNLVKIPVVGNGDITTPELAKEMMCKTGCDYVMIGRGAMGNPFIFKQIDDYLRSGTYDNFSINEKFDAFFVYLNYASNFKINFTQIKNQTFRFTKGLIGGKKIRQKLTMVKNHDDLMVLMKSAQRQVS